MNHCIVALLHCISTLHHYTFYSLDCMSTPRQCVRLLHYIITLMCFHCLSNHKHYVNYMTWRCTTLRYPTLHCISVKGYYLHLCHIPIFSQQVSHLTQRWCAHWSATSRKKHSSLALVCARDQIMCTDLFEPCPPHPRGFSSERSFHLTWSSLESCRVWHHVTPVAWHAQPRATMTGFPRFGMTVLGFARGLHSCKRKMLIDAVN